MLFTDNHDKERSILSSMVNLFKKSKDYVYGIWVYKALGIWKVITE